MTPISAYDTIVVGIGGMGSAACWQLARRGRRVLGIERFSIPHEHGSSHGLTRIIRLAYHEGPAYVALLRRAYALWREAGEAAGEPLLFVTGSLEGGPGGGAYFDGALASCREHDLPHEILGAGAVNRRFPGMDLPAGFRALYQPDGGFIACERALLAHVAMARAAGADIREREAVLGWSPIAGGGVRVVTDRGAYEAGRLILSAGAWIADLLPSLRGVAVPERNVMGWFLPGTPERFMPGVFPVTLMLDEGRGYYMVPTFAVPGVKIGLHHHLRESGSADGLSRAASADDEAALRRFLARCMPQANGPLSMLKACVYTNTPDEHFIIDTLPGNEDVIVASPCSGHGYKFASVVGEILAELVTAGASRFDLSPFRLSRFRDRPSPT
jgi:sarcosine oxidase